MRTLQGMFAARMLSIDPNSVRVSVRGFHEADVRITKHLEEIGEVFLRGYHLALAEPYAPLPQNCSLADHLAEIPQQQRGFAFEGAAMGLGLQDILFRGRWKRFHGFLHGIAAKYNYLAYVGIGWAIAAIPWTRCRVGRAITSLDPLLRWLVIDGYGFYHGYFRWKKYVVAKDRRRCLRGYESRAFDQGLGRSLWFVEGADAAQIAARIGEFLPSRRGDLWSGVGLACSYAGGVDAGVICRLQEAAGMHRAELSLGAAFAAKARLQAGNLTHDTEQACDLLCGLSAADAARVSDDCLCEVGGVGEQTRYEAWRQAVRSRFVHRPQWAKVSQEVPA